MIFSYGGDVPFDASVAVVTAGAFLLEESLNGNVQSLCVCSLASSLHKRGLPVWSPRAPFSPSCWCDCTLLKVLLFPLHTMWKEEKNNHQEVRA